MPTRKKTPEQAAAISLSEFARRVGCASKTVERYVQSGKIHGPAVVKSAGGKDKLLYDLAEPQYRAAEANSQHRFARAINTGKAERVTAQGAAPTADKGKKLTARQGLQLDNMLALADLSEFEVSQKLQQYLAGEYDLPDGPALDLLLAENGLSALRADTGKPGRKKAKPGDGEVIPAERRPQEHGGNLKSGKDRVDADVTGMAEMSEDELSRMDINALTKREAVLRVIAKQLEIGKTSGELIAIEKVYAGMFSFGVEMRKLIEAMPHRITDSIRNAKNRAEALNIFNREVNDVLNTLANYGEVIDTIKSSRGK